MHGNTVDVDICCGLSYVIEVSEKVSILHLHAISV